MAAILIVIHLMIVIALVVVVLLQRSEGGALGIGGGGGGGFMSARGASNALTKATAVLAAAFFATSIGLGILAGIASNPGDIFDSAVQPGQQEGGIFDQLGPAIPSESEPEIPQPQSEQPQVPETN